MADQLEQFDETSFNTRYWFPNTVILTVVNPREEDYIFQATSDVGVDVATGKMKTEARSYRVVAGGHERFPGSIANMYLDQMSKLLAQDEDKIQFMIDYSLRAQYYNQLIVGEDNLINTYTPNPAYLDNPGEIKTEKPAEVPFAGATTPEVSKKPGRPAKATTEA